jgi:hypothetical protein
MSLIVNDTELSLGWADPLSNEFYQISKNIDNFISLAYLSMEQATILVLLHHHHHHHLIISGSTVFVRTLAASHRRFHNLLRYLVRLFWMSDQPVAKASTYTGKHKTETGKESSTPRAISLTYAVL